MLNLSIQTLLDSRRISNNEN